MPFEKILTKLFEVNVETFNEADYEKLSNILTPYTELISPEINLPKIKADAVHLKSFKEILSYWIEINKSFDNSITRYECIEVGKKSLVRCFYEKLDMTIDTEIHFNEYAKITKIVNHLIEE